MSVLLFPETVISSSPLSPYDAGSRTRLLFGDPGGIGPLSARGKERRSFAAAWSPRRHRSHLGARERKTFLCRRGRGNACVDVIVVVPGDSDCIVAPAALRRGVSDALALRKPRRHRSPLGARERKILCCRLGRWNARVGVIVAVPGDSDIIVTIAALRRHSLKRARSSEPPAASALSRRSGKEDAPLPPRTPECSR